MTNSLNFTVAPVSPAVSYFRWQRKGCWFSCISDLLPFVLPNANCLMVLCFALEMGISKAAAQEKEGGFCAKQSESFGDKA